MSRPVCRTACLLLLCLFCSLNAGCALKGTADENAGRDFAFTFYALDGPELAVVGEYGGIWVEGALERRAMVGMGSLRLEGDLACDGRFDTQPTEKGRVRGVLECAGNRQIYVTLRTLGPDQGLGIGREARSEGDRADTDMLVLFFHPSREEALRRLPAVLLDIEAARARKQAAEE